ncbi:MAG: transketolase [Oscillospiraceae bacterium]|nr:transketolase [Oscillospiraceae bacterium]
MRSRYITSEIEARLKKEARNIRELIIEMITNAGSGHPGGALSAVEIVTYLYFYKMRIDPKNPKMHDRDRFILSKGHTCPVQYAALAQRGFFDTSELLTLREIGSILQGHPDMKKTPGVDMTTGSLGQGLSCGVGIALGGKAQKTSFKVYVVLGDGEIQSGQIWEAAAAAAHFGLGNLVVFVDNNGLQCDGFTKDIMNVEPIVRKFKAFGFRVAEIDGHSFTAIDRAVIDGENGDYGDYGDDGENGKNCANGRNGENGENGENSVRGGNGKNGENGESSVRGGNGKNGENDGSSENGESVGNNLNKPLAIVAKTIKGKGVSFMENQIAWHGLAPDKEQEKAALSEIRGGIS